MYKRDFPNPKLNLPKKIKISNREVGRCSFDAIDNYLNSVGVYVCTNIDLNHGPSGVSNIHAWILKIVSANILRSLYIRNDVVDAVNSRNPVALYFPLKAWFETVGALATILDLLESNLSHLDLVDRFEALALGNRGKGDLRVGKIEAKNVLSMIEKADEYILKITKLNNEHIFKEGGFESYFSDFYDVASNPTHPSFDAYEIVGRLEKGGVWKAKSPDEVKDTLIENLPEYGGLLLAPLFIESLCKEIFKIEKDNYKKLKYSKYFID